MNKTQRDILNFVKKYHKKHGYAPLKMEIADGIGTSKQNVQYHFTRIEELKEYPEYRRYFAGV